MFMVAAGGAGGYFNVGAPARIRWKPALWMGIGQVNPAPHVVQGCAPVQNSTAAILDV
jgi:hypothetical protein